MQNIRYQKNSKYFLVVAVYFLTITAATLSSAAVTRTITYTYDNLDRLTSVSYGGGASISYDYDDAGNILRAVMQGGIQEYGISTPTAKSALRRLSIFFRLFPSYGSSLIKSKATKNRVVIHKRAWRDEGQFGTSEQPIRLQSRW